MIAYKSADEVARMVDAGRVVARAHQVSARLLRPGVATVELDAAVRDVFAHQNAEPILHEQQLENLFPAAVGVSVNDVVAHGVPSERELQQGDLVSLDVACRSGGWCADAAWTYAVADVDAEADTLLSTGADVMSAVIKTLHAGNNWKEAPAVAASIAAAAGCRLIPAIVGHGVGRELHEDPMAPLALRDPSIEWPASFGFRDGLVIAVEFGLTMGTAEIRPGLDGWSIHTVDGAVAAHFEHTVAVTEDGPVVITDGVGAAS